MRSGQGSRTPPPPHTHTHTVVLHPTCCPGQRPRAADFRPGSSQLARPKPPLVKRVTTDSDQSLIAPYSLPRSPSLSPALPRSPSLSPALPRSPSLSPALPRSPPLSPALPHHALPPIRPFMLARALKIILSIGQPASPSFCHLSILKDEKRPSGSLGPSGQLICSERAPLSWSARTWGPASLCPVC